MLITDSNIIIIWYNFLLMFFDYAIQKRLQTLIQVMVTINS